MDIFLCELVITFAIYILYSHYTFPERININKMSVDGQEAELAKHLLLFFVTHIHIKSRDVVANIC